MMGRCARALLVMLTVLWPAVGWASPVSPRVETSTLEIEDLEADLEHIWVATRGGIEVYDQVDLRRRWRLTTLDGLASNVVWSLAVEGSTIVAHTSEGSCRAQRTTVGRPVFACISASTVGPRPFRSAGRWAGHRVTDELQHPRGRLVATAGAGLWLYGDEVQRLSPRGGPCTNHIVATVEYRGRLWLGAFDGGLCSTGDLRTFSRAELPARMINELLVADGRLWVASSEGLFSTRDGRHFVEDHRVEGAINGLASDGRSLYVTSPSALWRLPFDRAAGHPTPRGWWLPGGSRALQSVAVTAAGVWLASEDRGVILLRDGLDGRGTSIQRFDALSGLATSWFVDVAASSGGRVVAASLRHGFIELFADGSFKPFSVGGAWGLAIEWNAQTPVLASQSGVIWASPGNQRQVLPLPDPRVHAVVEYGSQVVIATEGGLLLMPSPGRVL